MHPATKLLIRALVRHGRGVLSETEKWLVAMDASATLDTHDRGAAVPPAAPAAIGTSTPSHVS